YGLRTSLVENGRKIDEHSDYFGFREFTNNGHSFYLNGKKIRLLGQSGHISEPQANRPLEWKVKFFRDWMEKGNCNHARLHARVQDKSWVEAADRAGMLITTETALWTTGFHSFDFAGSEEECYQNVRKHFMDALVRRDRNNPSVVIWSFSNEMSPILPTDVNISPKMAAATRVFKKIIDEAEEEDQSRIVQMSSAMDFIGNLKMYNLHYPKNWQGFPDHPHTQYWLEGSFLFPWYGARKYEYPSWGWRKNKPLYFGEFTCVFGATPDNQSTIVGDAAFEDADFGTERVDDKLWPAEVNSYRRLDVSGFCAWAAMFGPDYDDVTEWVKGRGKAAFVRAQRYIAVIDHSYRTKYIAGDDVPIELSVHNDTRSERTLELCCKVYDGEECIWTETMPSARFGPAELLAFTNRFRAPLTESKKELVYHAALTSDGNLADEWKKTIEIHPKSVGKSLPNDCAFLDPDGILAEMLSKRGITGGIFIDELEGAELDSCKTLWLNFKESKLRGGDWKKIRRKVERFVKNGGYAIIDNAEAALTDLPIEVKNGTGFAAGERLEITYAYLAAPFNPAVKGFVESDFSLWGEDYYVARRCYENPQSGNAIPILVAGADRGGLTKTPLMEIIYGSGAYLVSSLELFAKLGEAPIAAELIVSFAGAGPSVKLKETGLCLTDESIARMREVGMESENVGAAEALGKDIAIIDGLFYKESLIPQIKASLSGGGTVCLHALDEAQTGSVLKGLSLPGSVAPGEIGDGVWDSVTHTFNKEGGNWDAVRHAHRLADGMTGNHLFWIEGKGKLAPWTSATHHPKPASACVALGGEEGGFALTRRGAAVVYEAFGGILVIDNLRWQMDDIEEPERARRYLACLLTNLGAGLTEGVEKRMGIDYETAEERRERGHF
ncbi:MAG: hypothetical protein FWF03_07655, partial [Defluviitaleaceae bacterium]|nr:hypothetical protein [Defluviitaleaceae bacterium]